MHYCQHRQSMYMYPGVRPIGQGTGILQQPRHQQNSLFWKHAVVLRPSIGCSFPPSLWIHAKATRDTEPRNRLWNDCLGTLMFAAAANNARRLFFAFSFAFFSLLLLFLTKKNSCPLSILLGRRFRVIPTRNRLVRARR